MASYTFQALNLSVGLLHPCAKGGRSRLSAEDGGAQPHPHPVSSASCPQALGPRMVYGQGAWLAASWGSLPKAGHSISALNVESYDESHRLAHYVSNPQWNNKSLYHTVWVLSPRSSVIRHIIKKKKIFFFHFLF